MARLEGYEFGRVLVDGEEHDRDVIVLPGRVVANCGGGKDTGSCSRISPQCSTSYRLVW
jgi:hypothetical protein